MTLGHEKFDWIETRTTFFFNPWLMVFIFFMLVTFLHTFLALNAAGYARICIDIHSQRNTILQIFWANAPMPFEESRSKSVKLTPDRTQYCLTIPSLKNISKLRIDPQKHIGVIRLKAITIEQVGYAPIKLETATQLAQLKPVNDISSVSFDNNEGLRITIDGDDSQLGLDIETKKNFITRLTKASMQCEIYLYPLALLTAFILLVPGGLLFGLIFANRCHQWTLPLALFALSILFYSLSYCILVCFQYFGVDSHLLFTAMIFGFLFLLITLNFKFKRIRPLIDTLRQNQMLLAAYIIVLLVATFVATAPQLKPFETLNYRSISGPKTFMAFWSHDNSLQFLNGKAIADQEPFSKYYGGGQQVYQVEDREILPGILYAVFRKMSYSFSSYIGTSFLSYNLLASAMNIMLIFPLWALFDLFFPNLRSKNFFLLVLFSINAFVLPNYYFAWFKFAGAALFLSALGWLIVDVGKYKSWLWAGIGFGLSTNMHAGNALGIPFFLIYFCYLNGVTNGWRLGPTLFYPILLITIFITLNAPWSIVKKIYFFENHVLLREHFLMGTFSKDGLIGAVTLFFENTSIGEQVEFRLGRLLKAFRMPEIVELIKFFKTEKLGRSMLKWCQLEWNYIAILLYPLLLFMIPGDIINRIFHRPKKRDIALPVNRFQPNTKLLGWIAATTLVTIILASYGPHNPDLTYSNPMGVIVFIQMLLIGSIFNGGSVLLIGFCLYSIFSVWRLITSFLYLNSFS